ncbi:uncharacterized protein TNIN_326741, partial [Trichonephila inaurata madagascariensis]
KTFFKWK